MSRFSRINTIWRKELVDTLRDKRTVIAMVLVPMVLYPALMLGSLQAYEVQMGRLVREEYTVAVANEEASAWLRRVIQTDPARLVDEPNLPAEEVIRRSREEPNAAPAEPNPELRGRKTEAARVGVRERPPEYVVVVVPDVKTAVEEGAAHVGVLFAEERPSIKDEGTLELTLVFDESEIRSGIAAAGLQGILDRANAVNVRARLARFNLHVDFVEPLKVREANVASPEKMTGSVLGQVVPLILIIMTITGAIYPAIDLTAGERERGTLETLMVAPVPTVDLIIGKFVVVTLISLMSGTLNLLSIGGTIYLGGLGDLFARGGAFMFPLKALPFIFLLLVPLSVMFSAMLLAVCSFARSFKEAQNYVVPVMMAGLIPGVVGVLPGTRLEGPIVIMPVANIVVLTREMFLNRFDLGMIALVAMSTSLYAAAAVAVAARLFGQEAVLFADSGSIRTLFMRRFFKPRSVPSAGAALLIISIVYTLNFYIQQSLERSGVASGLAHLGYIALTLALLLLALPVGAAIYLRLNLVDTFALRPPPPGAILAALCIGGSVWVLAPAWFALQDMFLPIPPEVQALMQAKQAELFGDASIWTLVLVLAVVPAVCEEAFFRGFALSGLRGGLGKVGAVLAVAFAFGLFHYSAYRTPFTTALGAVLGLLAVQYRSIWPPMLAHLLNNSMSLLANSPQGLQPWLAKIGYTTDENHVAAEPWLFGAMGLFVLGLLICRFDPRRVARPPEVGNSRVAVAR